MCAVQRELTFIRRHNVGNEGQTLDRAGRLPSPKQSRKIVVPADTHLVNVIGDVGGLTPMPTDNDKPTLKIAGTAAHRPP